MAVNPIAQTAEPLHRIDGVQLYTAQAGIKKEHHDDLILMVINPKSTVGAVFTQNKFCAAPVYIAKQHLFNENGIRALIINTGNANAGMGVSGRENALLMCQAAAQQVGCSLEQVLPFSTGVILESLPIEKIQAALPSVSPSNWADAARAIMTNDTVAKSSSHCAKIGNYHTVHATGIAKGSSMICPNMATMLGFIATDAHIAQPVLQQMTEDIANETFNCITTDGDTSTNDSFVIIATGCSGQNEIDNIADPRYIQVYELLKTVALELAQAIVRDGENANKLITIQVHHATSHEEAQKVAYAIAHSPAVKTAFSGSVANLGHILTAIGYSGVDINIDALDVYLNDVLAIEHSSGYASHQAIQPIMNESEITIRVDLKTGKSQATIYTCA